MRDNKNPKDMNGTSINVGDFVVFCNASDNLLRGLPDEEQHTIKSMVGHSFEVQGFDEHGNIELCLEYGDEVHFIWVDGSDLKSIGVKPPDLSE